MVRGSMVAREIDLEEKRVCVPTPMIEEPFFSLPVAAAPTIPDIVVPAPAAAPTIPDIVMPIPVVSCPTVAINDDREPVLQDLTEPIATDEGIHNSPKRIMCHKLRYKMYQKLRPLEGLKESGGQLFLATIKFIIQKRFIWRVIPLHMKKS